MKWKLCSGGWKNGNRMGMDWRWKCERMGVDIVSISATTLWDSWDTFPPTLEITRTTCIWSPPSFATIAVVFYWSLWKALGTLPQTTQPRERERGIGKGMSEIGVEQ